MMALSFHGIHDASLRLEVKIWRCFYRRIDTLNFNHLMRTLVAFLRTAFRLFFSDLQLVADDGKLRVRLNATDSKADPVGADKPIESSDLIEIRAALKQLLGQHENTRRTLRHIAALESLLKRNGLDVIDRLPLNLMIRAQDQLDALTKGSASNNAALIYLKAMLQVAIMKHEESDKRPNGVFQFLSDFNNLDKVVVDTATFSDFHEALKDLPDSTPATSKMKDRPPPLFHPVLPSRDRVSR